MTEHKCPRCGAALLPVRWFPDVWGCVACKETWWERELPRPTVQPLPMAGDLFDGVA